MTVSPSKLQFLPIIQGRDDCIAAITLCRPEMANAFDAAMIASLSSQFSEVKQHKNCRALVIRADGKHFSAGADLAWMKQSAQLTYQENLDDARRLTAMFESLANCPIPTIAQVHGAAFGGAVGITACCDIVLADVGTRFCLSEARLGLLPAVIMPYLARRIQPGALGRMMLTGRTVAAEEAKAIGLVDCVTAAETKNQVLRQELNDILACSKESQKAIKTLRGQLRQGNYQQNVATGEAIASARTGEAGQHGLAMFFAKTEPNWKINLASNWELG